MHDNGTEGCGEEGILSAQQHGKNTHGIPRGGEQGGRRLPGGMTEGAHSLTLSKEDVQTRDRNRLGAKQTCSGHGLYTRNLTSKTIFFLMSIYF